MNLESLDLSPPPPFQPLPRIPCSCPPIVHNGATGAQNSSHSSNPTNNNENHWFHCPVCLGKWDSLVRVPMGLPCGHTLCRKCMCQLPSMNQHHRHGPGPVGSSVGIGIPNVALLDWLEYPAQVSRTKNILFNLPGPRIEPDCITSIYHLADIGTLLRSHGNHNHNHSSQGPISRAIQRKVLNLILALSWNGQNRVCRAAKSLGERILVEMTGAISQMSHYTAQQQLWGAIRSRACQFMGPAMQEEALKLVVLALEDGSPLSRKVLVMFVVQRLTPQFPQASKTAIGHIIQLLYRASAFDVIKRLNASSLMTLRPEFRNYEALRREHDAQIVKIALESGIRFSPEQWSSILYGDTNHKPHMQSIIDKLQAPQTFLQMTTDFLVNIQRLTDADDGAFLLSVHPMFQLLASIDLALDGPTVSWSYVSQVLGAIHTVLVAWFRFNPKSNKGHHINHTHHARRTANTRQNLHPGTTILNQNLGPPPPSINVAQQQNYSSRLGQPQVQSQSQFPPLSPFFGTLPQVQPLLSPTPTFGSGFNGNGLFMDEASSNLEAKNEQEINKILTESRLLRARIKELQEKNPTGAQELEAEAANLDQDLSHLFQRVGLGQ